jgi:hypothetical protein
MNIEKLYKVSNAVINDIDENKIKQLFSTFDTALSQLASAPQQVQYQTNFSTAKSNFFEALGNCLFNDFGAVDLQIIDELGGTSLLGNNLKDKIQGILDRVNTSMLPAQARTEIQPIKQGFDKFIANLSSMTGLFDNLGLEPEDTLDNEHGEVSIVLPRNIINGDFSNFEKDVKNFRQFLDCIQNISDDKDEYEITKISSSDFMFTILCGLGFAKAISMAINPILDMFIKIQTIRENNLRLQQMKAPKEVEKSMRDWETGLVEKTIEETSKIMLANCKNKKGRTDPEMKSHIKSELKMLVEKFDNGYQVVVTMNEAHSEEYDESEENVAEDKNITDLRQELKTLNANSEKVLASIQEVGQILKLPAYSETEETEEPTEAPKTLNKKIK